MPVREEEDRDHDDVEDESRDPDPREDDVDQHEARIIDVRADEAADRAYQTHEEPKASSSAGVDAFTIAAATATGTPASTSRS